MKNKNLYFSLYEYIEINNDLRIETIADNVKQLCNYLEKPATTLYSKGVKKKKGLRLKLTVNGKKYILIVDEDNNDL